ncbi:MAG: HAD family hydrolase, partial [Ktedonobacteraceae bacterium]
EHLEEIMQNYPADHYATIDDKPQILADTKARMRERVTTVFVEQGKYAEQKPANFHPDISVLHIADLRNLSADQFIKGHK